MQHVRHTLSAVLTAAALIAGTAACGSLVPGSAYAAGTATPTATPDPLAGLTADQIAKRAIANLNDATSVRYAGTAMGSGQSVSVNLTLVRGQGCEGSMDYYGKGTLQLVYNGKSLWMRLSDAFYKSVGVSAAKIRALSGKWLKDPEKSVLGELPPVCSLGTIADSMGRHDVGMTKGAATTVDGQRALTITQAGGSKAIYVSDTARPELLQLSSLGSGSLESTVGSITFRDYNRPATITPPPASKTLNVGELGPKIGPLMV